MTLRGRTPPPFVHVVLAGAALLALLIGGTATFGAWGSIGVRRAALYALAAIAMHGASRYAGEASVHLRVGAYVVLAALTVDERVLFRVEVLAPLAALAVADLVIHRADLSRPRIQAGTAAKLIAGLATLGLVGLLTTLVLLASERLVLVRLGATVLIAWVLVTLFALRPATRRPEALLVGAGAFSIGFVLLAAPVLPFGPLLAWWAIITAGALAVLTGTVTHSGPGLAPETRRHAQRVASMPDPLLAPLAEDVRRFIETGDGGRALSQRIEHALGRSENGNLLPALSGAQSKGARPSRGDRTRALAELLQVPHVPKREEGP